MFVTTGDAFCWHWVYPIPLGDRLRKISDQKDDLKNPEDQTWPNLEKSLVRDTHTHTSRERHFFSIWGLGFKHAVIFFWVGPKMPNSPSCHSFQKNTGWWFYPWCIGENLSDRESPLSSQPINVDTTIVMNHHASWGLPVISWLVHP